MQTTAYYFAKIGFSSNANGPDHAGGSENLCTVQAVHTALESSQTFGRSPTLFAKSGWMDALTRVLLGHKEELWPKKLKKRQPNVLIGLFMYFHFN